MSFVVTGTANVFTVPNNAAFFGDAFTAEIWFKHTVDPNDYAYAMGLGSTSATGWTIYSSVGAGADVRKPRLNVNNGTQRNVDGVQLANDTWHHLAFTWNGTSVIGYVNGDPIGTTSGAGAMGTNNNLLSFGVIQADATYRNIQLSDARIWSTVRTAQEIADNYNVRQVGNEVGLASYWPGTEGAGNTLNDITANARNGTSSAGSWVADDPTFVVAGAGVPSYKALLGVGL